VLVIFIDPDARGLSQDSQPLPLFYFLVVQLPQNAPIGGAYVMMVQGCALQE
jgi:hypothetical protein